MMLNRWHVLGWLALSLACETQTQAFEAIHQPIDASVDAGANLDEDRSVAARVLCTELKLAFYDEHGLVRDPSYLSVAREHSKAVVEELDDLMMSEQSVSDYQIVIAFAALDRMAAWCLEGGSQLETTIGLDIFEVGLERIEQLRASRSKDDPLIPVLLNVLFETANTVGSLEHFWFYHGETLPSVLHGDAGMKGENEDLFFASRLGEINKNGRKKDAKKIAELSEAAREFWEEGLFNESYSSVWTSRRKYDSATFDMQTISIRIVMKRAMEVTRRYEGLSE